MDTIDVDPVIPRAPSVAHLLPCGINLTGAARVSTYFMPSAADDKGRRTASFRGRLLEGTRIALPKGMQGLVLKETAPSSDEAAPDATGAGEVSFESFADPFAAQGGNAFAAAPDPAADADRSSGHRRWVCDGQFGELTYWNHDKPTTEADSVPKALRWHALAGALHDSVESSDIELERGMV